MVAETAAVVKLAQKADADAKLAEKAEAQPSVSGFVHALATLRRAVAAKSVKRIVERYLEGGETSGCEMRARVHERSLTIFTWL